MFEQIKNRLTFENYSKNGVTLPRYDGEELKEVSIGAEVLLGGLDGAGLGVAGGFAAAGATTAAVMALGTASIGTAIATLSGAAATNATLAALGGGGIVLGTTILGAATLGVGLLVGGAIFSITGGKLSDKADEAWSQMKKDEEKINNICNYLTELRSTSNNYYDTISDVNSIYQKHLKDFTNIVTMLEHKDWNTFTAEERNVTENTVLLVGLLYNMCKVELVLKGKDDNDMNAINKSAIETSITNAKSVLNYKS